MEHFDVVIVGSGPAGISTALSLHKIAPHLAARTVVLEKERHPRPKLCGGGVTILAHPVMHWLDIGWERLDVPHAPIHTVQLRFEDRQIVLHWPDMFRIIRREEFDGRLVEIARQRGVEVREETPLTGLRPVEGGVLLTTPTGDIHAQAVVGADGAKSVVRQKMALPPTAGPPRVSRLLEVLTPEVAETTPEFVNNCAVFDFTPVPEGVQGYLWDFPSFVAGRPMMNRGVFDSRILSDRPRARLTAVLRDYLARRSRSLDDCELKGHPERYYDPAGVYSAPHVLLVGDAAGVDPLLGEGISWALRYGPLAAQELRLAFAGDDFSFAGYSQRLADSDVGQGLRQRVRLARRSFRRSRRFMRLGWPALGLIARYLGWQAVREARRPFQPP